MYNLENLVKERIKTTNTLFGVLLLRGPDCVNENSQIQIELRKKIKELNITLPVINVCLDPNNMPWPYPLTNVLYWFAPRKEKHLFYTANDNIYKDLENHYKFALDSSGLTDENFVKQINEPIIKETEEMFEEEEKQELPPTSKMLRGLAKEMWNSAKAAGKGLPVLVPAEVATERYTICEGCPKFTEEFRCTECGCFMKKKTQLAQSSCPLGKWDKFNKE